MVFAGIRAYACVLKWKARKTQPFFGASNPDEDAPTSIAPTSTGRNSPEGRASIAAAEQWCKERRF